jgi:hypothetical protein
MSCSASSAVMVLAMGGGGDRGDEPPLPPIDATAKFGPTPVCSHISRQTQTKAKHPALSLWVPASGHLVPISEQTYRSEIFILRYRPFKCVN